MRVALDAGAYKPERAYPEDAGYDLRSMYTQTVPARGSSVFFTGVHVEIPVGYAGKICSKSGLNVRHNITATGLIDSGYTGAITVKLYNHGTQNYEVKEGDKIAQLVIVPVFRDEVEIVPSIDGGKRGANGFGSTGR